MEFQLTHTQLAQIVNTRDDCLLAELLFSCVEPADSGLCKLSWEFEDMLEDHIAFAGDNGDSTHDYVNDIVDAFNSALQDIRS